MFKIPTQLLCTFDTPRTMILWSRVVVVAVVVYKHEQSEMEVALSGCCLNSLHFSIGFILTVVDTKGTAAADTDGEM